MPEPSDREATLDVPAVHTSPQGIQRRGLMLVLSSPSGAGKSTIATRLLREDPNLTLSVSATTRARRGNEIDGQDYHFMSVAEFEMKRDASHFLEHAEVHGNHYATPIEPVREAMAAGRDMLFDIDWQGAAQMFEQARGDIASVFILPPSMEELGRRLQRRATDTETVIARRLANARREIEEWTRYDYVVVNDDLGRAFDQVKAILTAERLRRERRPGLHGFVKELLR